MSEEGGGGHERVLWENQSWAFSNSDNSGGGGSEEKSRKKVQGGVALPSKKRGRGGVSKNGKGSGGGGGDQENGGKGGGESDHEIHIWTERERRKKMRNMFANLHALLPQLPAKVKLILRLMDICFLHDGSFFFFDEYMMAISLDL